MTLESGSILVEPKVEAPSAESGGDITLNGYKIRRFRRRDAAGVCQCFRAVYGEHYLSDRVYDPDYFVKSNREGFLISYVALDPGGQVVGHLALMRSAPFDRLLEIAQGVVMAEHRRGGLFNRMVERVLLAAEEKGSVGVFGTSLTNHTISQHALHNFGFRDAGYEIDYVPARMMAHEKSASGAVATLIQHWTIDKGAGLASHMPGCYEEILQELYAYTGQERMFKPTAPSLPPNSRSRSEVVDLPRFDLTRCIFHVAGADMGELIGKAEAQAKEDGRGMVQAIVNLGQPGCGPATEALRERGYWFGGLLPRWMDDDALLMQKSLAAPNFDEIKPSTAMAKKLLDYLRSAHGAAVDRVSKAA